MKPLLDLNLLADALPLDSAVRIDLREGVPVFRVTPDVQERIEALLDKRGNAALTPEELRELQQYEELDDFLSLVNRLVRDATPGRRT